MYLQQEWYINCLIASMYWRALNIFYSNFRVLTVGASLFTCVLYFLATEPLFAIPLFWSKLLSNALVILFFHIFQQDRLYLFYNLGVTRLFLYISCVALDLIIWLGLILITQLML